MLFSGAGGAAENMAIDQALLQRTDQSREPVLRIYSWDQPTLSLGYFQASGDRKTHVESQDVACVRRATGGGAILHHHELTYSIVMPIESNQTQARLKLYRQMHDAFIQALLRWDIRLTRHADAGGRLGVENAFLCFQRRTEDDLVHSGYKVLGSAQRRTRHSVLQHGSLLISASPFASQLPGLADLTSCSFTARDLATELVTATTQTTGLTWQKGTVDLYDPVEVQSIEEERFGNPKWLARR